MRCRLYQLRRFLRRLHTTRSAPSRVNGVAAHVGTQPGHGSDEGRDGLVQRHLEALAGTPDDLPTLLRTQLQTAWSVDLRIDAYLGYLNHGVYIARALDCAI